MQTNRTARFAYLSLQTTADYEWCEKDKQHLFMHSKQSWHRQRFSNGIKTPTNLPSCRGEMYSWNILIEAQKMREEHVLAQTVDHCDGAPMTEHTPT